jgi:hypothetical protein
MDPDVPKNDPGRLKTLLVEVEKGWYVEKISLHSTLGG